MIISGVQTGDTRWLAAHLQNAADNEMIELAEVTGTVAQDVDGALAEFDALTAGTRAKQGVYAAFINPPQPLSREQFMRALEVIEQRLGLSGQPRLVLFHVKNGRHHCHAVWSRIDTACMKAIQLSHDRQKLRRCARELAAEFGLTPPPNLAQDRGAERFAEPPSPTKAEKAMAKISGIAVEERRAAITACYRQADSAESFVSALEQAGYMLARGDKRCLVVVDFAGHVHSLARQIDGAKTKDIKKKLEALDVSRLLRVDSAKALMAQRAQAQQDVARISAEKRAAALEAEYKLKIAQAKRKAKLDLLWQQMKIRQMHEWKVLLAHIKADEELRLKRHWTQIGLARYLKKIAVIRQLLEHYAAKKRRSLEEYYLQLRVSLQRRHENEARELKRRYEALLRLAAREMACFGINWAGAGSGVPAYSVFMPQLIVLPDPTAFAVAVGYGSEAFAEESSYERSRRSVPEDLRYNLRGDLVGGGAFEGSILTTFNESAWGAGAAPPEEADTDTDEEKAGASAHVPRNDGMSPI